MKIAKDKDGELYLFYTDNIVRNIEEGYWEVASIDNINLPSCIKLPNEDFPHLANMTFDDEPIQMCLCVNDDKLHTVKVEVLDKLYADRDAYAARIAEYNSLPWYRKLFKTSI